MKHIPTYDKPLDLASIDSRMGGSIDHEDSLPTRRPERRKSLKYNLALGAIILGGSAVMVEAIASGMDGAIRDHYSGRAKVTHLDSANRAP